MAVARYGGMKDEIYWGNVIITLIITPSYMNYGRISVSVAAS